MTCSTNIKVIWQEAKIDIRLFHINDSTEDKPIIYISTGPQILTKLLESSSDAVFKTQSQNKNQCVILMFVDGNFLTPERLKTTVDSYHSQTKNKDESQAIRILQVSTVNILQLTSQS
uniref:Uncharacterized protein n=1 Tax=Rhizophagus irregularis (strain DAOM 181602 / DAOM 197198 / MUCL 43194) TaxID=747089 RepID=U9UM24_RHIID